MAPFCVMRRRPRWRYLPIIQQIDKKLGSNVTWEYFCLHKRSKLFWSDMVRWCVVHQESEHFGNHFERFRVIFSSSSFCLSLRAGSCQRGNGGFVKSTFVCFGCIFSLGSENGKCVCVCVCERERERERKRVRWRDGERERRLTSSSSLTSSAEALNLYLLYTERRKQRYSESPEPRRSLEDGDEGYICCSTSRTVSIILNCINTIAYRTSLRLLLYKVLHALTNQYLRSRM